MQSNQPGVPRCPYCASPDTRRWDRHLSRADGQAYDIYRCAGCASAFVHPPPSAAYLAAFYGGSQNSHGGQLQAASIEEHYQAILRREQVFPNSTIDAARIARRAREHARGDDFLDIGAGYGFFTRAAVQAGFRCTAVEAGANNCRVFEMMNGFGPLQAMFDASFAAAHPARYDVVLLSQVLEHLPHPAAVVEQINAILRPGGLCIIAVPHFGSDLSRLQGRNDMFIVPPEHINFFSVAGLKALFEARSMRCIELETVSRFDRQRLRARLKSNALGAAAGAVLGAGYALADRRGRGMFINAYFRKPGP